MGAALTYARRYALFTLVGIAGEDQLLAEIAGLGARDARGSHKAFAYVGQRDHKGHRLNRRWFKSKREIKRFGVI